jgi:hypothetical protein
VRQAAAPPAAWSAPRRGVLQAGFACSTGVLFQGARQAGPVVFCPGAPLRQGKWRQADRATVRWAAQAAVLQGAAGWRAAALPEVPRGETVEAWKAVRPAVRRDALEQRAPVARLAVPKARVVPPEHVAVVGAPQGLAGVAVAVAPVVWRLASRDRGLPARTWRCRSRSPAPSS